MENQNTQDTSAFSGESITSELAHYYGHWFWSEEQTAWIKSLLLFFDGIALALPKKTADDLVGSNPILAQPLVEKGLLQNYPPDIWLESLGCGATGPARRLIEAQERKETPSIDDLIYLESGASWQETPSKRSDALSGNDRFFTIVDEFAQRLQLAGKQYGGNPSQMRALSVGVTSWLLSQHLPKVLIHPVIDDPTAASFVGSVIGSRRTVSSEVILADLLSLSIDLSIVPLDEVLAYREQHGSDYRAYMRDVRQFAIELSMMPELDQGRALAARKAGINDRARHLRETSRKAFARQGAGLTFGIAGAAASLTKGDFWSATFALGAAAAALTQPTPNAIGAAYTYILDIKNDYWTRERQGKKNR